MASCEAEAGGTGKDGGQGRWDVEGTFGFINVRAQGRAPTQDARHPNQEGTIPCAQG
jgi:hypothetical protein